MDKGHPGGTPTQAVRPGKMATLHWLTVFCVVAGVSLILLRDEVGGRALRQWLLDGHRHFGVFVLLTSLVGSQPSIVKSIGEMGSPFLVVVGGGLGLAIVFGIAGMILGRTASR